MPQPSPRPTARSRLLAVWHSVVMGQLAVLILPPVLLVLLLLCVPDGGTRRAEQPPMQPLGRHLRETGTAVRLAVLPGAPAHQLTTRALTDGCTASPSAVTRSSCVPTWNAP